MFNVGDFPTDYAPVDLLSVDNQVSYYRPGLDPAYTLPNDISIAVDNNKGYPGFIFGQTAPSTNFTDKPIAFNSPSILFPQAASDPGNSPAGDSGGFGLQQVTAAAMAVVQLLNVVKGAQTVNPVTQIAKPDGTILTRAPNGVITVSKPQPGIATSTPEGGIIVNNGNGSYDYISPSGARSTNTYPVSGSQSIFSGGGGLPINGQTLMFGGLGLLALLLLKNK